MLPSENSEPAVKLRPDYAEAYYNLGMSFEEAGEPEPAVAALRTAVRLRPESAIMHLGLALAQRADDKQAALEFRQASAEGHNNLGFALLQKGDLREAIRELRQSVQLKPDYAGAHFNLGLTLRESGDLPSALEQFQLARQLETH